MSSQRLEGVVLHIDQHMARARSRFPGCLGAGVLSVFGLWILVTVLGEAAARAGTSLLVLGLCALIPGMVLRSLLGKALGRSGGGRQGHPFIQGVATQFVGFALMRHVIAPADIPIRNVRMRDFNGREHHVRIEGELSSGTVNVGDEIMVEGRLERGSLLFRRGYNRRIRAEIRLR